MRTMDALPSPLRSGIEGGGRTVRTRYLIQNACGPYSGLWLHRATGCTAPTPAPPRKGEGRMAALIIALFLLFTLPVLAQTFPPLTGRVVDAVNLLKPEERAALEAKLKAHEDRTTDQVVVATLRSLE